MSEAWTEVILRKTKENKEKPLRQRETVFLGIVGPNPRQITFSLKTNEQTNFGK